MLALDPHAQAPETIDSRDRCDLPGRSELAMMKHRDLLAIRCNCRVFSLQHRMN
jgi:hypothetical protein